VGLHTDRMTDKPIWLDKLRLGGANNSHIARYWMRTVLDAERGSYGNSCGQTADQQFICVLSRSLTLDGLPRKEGNHVHTSACNNERRKKQTKAKCACQSGSVTTPIACCDVNQNGTAAASLQAKSSDMPENLSQAAFVFISQQLSGIT